MKKVNYSHPWFVYIAECKDSSLYVGIAKDVDKRIKEHNNTKKCRYTRFRKPLKLKYKKSCQNYSMARKKESEIKKFSRKKKLALINSNYNFLKENIQKRDLSPWVQGSRSKKFTV